jgi:hypothetical protein
MISSFSAFCPICKKTVSKTVLRHGSLEKLRKGEGGIGLAHATNDPRVGEHKWTESDTQVITRLRKLLREDERSQP